MGKFEEVDSCINFINNMDHWEDDEKEYAMDLVGLFNEEDFEALLKNLPSKDARWKVRCAQIMMGSLTKSSLKVLGGLLDSDNVDQVESVLESMQHFGPEFNKSDYVTEEAFLNALACLTQISTENKISTYFLEYLHSVNPTK